MISAFGVDHGGISKSAASTVAEVATKTKSKAWKPMNALKTAGGFRRTGASVTEIGNKTKGAQVGAGGASIRSETHGGSWALRPKRTVTHTENGKRIHQKVTGGGVTTKGKIALGSGAAGAGGAGIAGYQRYKNKY